MACFTVPAVEAVVATIVRKSVESKEKKYAVPAEALSGDAAQTAQKIPFSRKLRWLTSLLWGGSVLLAFEHIWHGEITAWFPFLTAAADPEDLAEMLHEMATVGVTMALLVTAVWGCMVAVSALLEKRAEKAAKEEQA